LSREKFWEEVPAPPRDKRRRKWVIEDAEKVSSMAKTCAVCKCEVQLGTGTYYAGRLIHKDCLDMAKIQRFKLMKAQKN